jgi:hypothetical protein
VALGQFGHAIRVERLSKIKRTDAHCLNRHWHITVAGDHDGRQLSTPFSFLRIASVVPM